MEKELLRKLGEETIYTAKGHFKASDLRRFQSKIVITVCMLLNIAGIIGISPLCDKWLSAFGIVGTFFLFYWDAEEGKDYKARHKQLGEEYLAIHKEIRAAWFIPETQTELIITLNQRVIELGKINKPDIPWLAWKMSHRAIERKSEIDNWFEE